MFKLICPYCQNKFKHTQFLTGYPYWLKCHNCGKEFNKFKHIFVDLQLWLVAAFPSLLIMGITYELISWIFSFDAFDPLSMKIFFALVWFVGFYYCHAILYVWWITWIAKREKQREARNEN